MECIVDIKNWMTNNFLLLNSEKTELIIGPKNHTSNNLEHCLRVNPNSLSYPFPLVLHVHVRVRANSGFDRGVGLRGRYPSKHSIFASLLETKGYPEHTAARSSREYFRLK